MIDQHQIAQSILRQLSFARSVRFESNELR